MGLWRENPLSAVKEYPFDFKRYIEERLREIDDLDERRFAKQVLLEGLGKAIQMNEKRYLSLEQRIFQETEPDVNCYETAMTVIDREAYDPTNETLFPVCREDLKEEQLSGQLSTEKERWLGTVFLKGTESELKSFAQTERFSGSKNTKDDPKPVFVHVRPAGRYRKAIEDLYRMFLDNGIPWETINTAYLDRFFDVYTEANQQVCCMDEITVDFKQYKENIRFGMLPLWNVKRLTFDNMDFMEPGIDGIYYEHEFLLPEDMEGNGCLIQGNEDIMEIRHEAGKIILKSAKENYEDWQAIYFIQKEPVHSLNYDEPILTNRKKDSFLRRLSCKTGKTLLTKTDLFRRIMELETGEYMQVERYEIRESTEEYPAMESMNWFIQSEVFLMDSRRILCLFFKARKSDYLNESMMRFALSRLQMEINEYRLAGVML